ncbi:adenylosuccinate lyase [Spiroplasma endosymbiont of Labia minor]|uniref:adenylosuccinate lyase n=1 Tax=Spiroplasma endosymbiont of Labia minor TaxID=3066305 RepID=UPI0030D49BB6
MINRYTNDKIVEIWSDKNKYETWLEIEKLIVEAWSSIGVIPNEDAKLIRNKAQININRMFELEIENKHEMVAFTRAISETLDDEKRWIHFGLTSTDIIDTAQNFLIKESNEVVQNEMIKLGETLFSLAKKYKNTLIMGRSHGIYGEPTSLGLKFLLWFDEIGRQIERLLFSKKQIEITKISGSMGNYVHIEPEIEEFVAEKLKLSIDSINTQVTQRDRHAFLLSCFANIASTLEKIAQEIRLFSRSEIKEWNEGFGVNQKGSSSMPHKRNPISSENISGLSRYIRSFVSVSFENNLLWHERDISHSSNERLILPDVFNILVYSINRLTDTLEKLVIDKNEINKHIKEAKNIYFSQTLLTYIIKTTKFSREEIYDFIQAATIKAMNENKDFKSILEQNNIQKFISINALNKIFKDEYFLRNTEKIYERIDISWLKKMT